MVIFLGMLAAIGISTGIGAVSSPLLNLANQGLNTLIPVTKPTPQELIALRYRGEIEKPKFLEWMKTWGIDNTISEILFSGNQQILDVANLIIAFRRGMLDKDSKINEQTFFARMEQIGIAPDTAKDYLQTTQEFENTQEIFLWLVREVFDDAKRKKLQLDDEFPKEALEFGARLGIPEYRMRNNWGAHWILASPEQISSVLHRYRPERRKFWENEVKELGLEPDKVQTNSEDLLDLLKFADVNPFYRQKIASIAYDDMGRIETRWMIRFKFVKIDEAAYLYERLGLPPTIAKRVAQVVFVTQSLTDWQDSIKLGAMTFEDVLKELTEWEIVKPELIEVVKRKVAPQLFEGIKEERDFTKTLIADGFKTGTIDRTKAIELLTAINYSDLQVKIIMEKLDIEKQKRSTTTTKAEKLISKADIKQQFTSGIIPRDEALDELKRVGYAEKDRIELIELWEIVQAGKKK